MSKLRNIVFVFAIVLLAIFALVTNSGKVTATEGCDWYLQHTPSPEHPDGWGECMWNTPTPEVTATATIPTLPPHCEDDEDGEKHCNTYTPTPEPTDEVTSTPEPTKEVTSTPEPTDEVTPTVSPTPPTPVPTETKVVCEHKCIYKLGGIPGTHAVTAVSPNGAGPYTWQVKFKDVWYDIYDCYGIVIETTAESRGTTSIVRLTVDGTAPSDPNSYRISGGAAAYLFDDHSY